MNMKYEKYEKIASNPYIVHLEAHPFICINSCLHIYKLTPIYLQIHIYLQSHHHYIFTNSLPFIYKTIFISIRLDIHPYIFTNSSLYV